MARIKQVLIIALVAALVIVIFQNVASVETTVLFWTMRMPRFVLLVLALLTGALFGYVMGRRGRTKKKAA